ncbi:hypothetical protein, partial [Streptomyces sp. NRRL WC-3725]|uniref:hypothetical protein n=1 Tax=Streptomyces sp. NRRL WC-3725 TaxID=1463933 RepID=UPI001F17F663
PNADEVRAHLRAAQACRVHTEVSGRQLLSGWTVLPAGAGRNLGYELVGHSDLLPVGLDGQPLALAVLTSPSPTGPHEEGCMPGTAPLEGRAELGRWRIACIPVRLPLVEAPQEGGSAIPKIVKRSALMSGGTTGTTAKITPQM